MENRRRYPRLPVRLPVWFGGHREGTVHNLSLSGCQLKSDKPGQPGDYLLLRLSLLDDPTPLLINSAEVRWSSGSDFGVDFLSVHPPDQERLHHYLDYLQGG